MRVICIRGQKQGELTYLGFPVAKDKWIYEGRVYTVLQEEVLFGEKSYALEERPGNLLYRADRFIPLSDIDEKEFERNYNKELA